MQDVEQQSGNEEAAMHSENENTNRVYFRTQLLQREGKKKHMKVVKMVTIFSSLPVK